MCFAFTGLYMHGFFFVQHIMAFCKLIVKYKMLIGVGRCSVLKIQAKRLCSMFMYNEDLDEGSFDFKTQKK